MNSSTSSQLLKTRSLFNTLTPRVGDVDHRFCCHLGLVPVVDWAWDAEDVHHPAARAVALPAGLVMEGVVGVGRPRGQAEAARAALVARNEDLRALAVLRHAVLHGEHRFVRFGQIAVVHVRVEIADAGALQARPRRVIGAGPAGGVFFFGGVVQRLEGAAMVDAAAPREDAGVVAVVADGAAQRQFQVLRPLFAAEVDPRGRFFVDEDTEFVAGFDEGVIVRVVGESHDVEARLLELQRVLAVQRLGHGVADVGVVLVAVDADQHEWLAVEPEAIFAQLEFADAERIFDAVHRFVAVETSGS